MNGIAQEQIIFSKFIDYTHKLQNKYGHVIAFPENIFDIIKVLNHPITGQPIGITISTSTKATHDNKLRIRLEDPSGKLVYGTLKCDEYLKLDTNGKLHHHYFSFHFEASDDQDTLYSFRLDYNPKSSPPLHAHDYNYKNTKIHLLFPNDTKLNLNLIDFCTTLQILSYYFLHQFKYPLNYGDEYTKIIKSTRSIYDEQR